MRIIERVLALVALSAAAIFVSVGLNRPVFLDEANTVIIAGHGFQGVIGGLKVDNNFPAYYLLLSLWMRLFGNSEAALRILSGLFYLGGCLGTFLLARRLSASRWAAWYGAMLYEGSVLAIRQAQNIRVYSLLGLLSAFSCYAFLRIFRDRDRTLAIWALFIAVNVVGTFTHVWFWFVLAAQFSSLVIFERRQLGLFLVAASAIAAPCAFLWGPIFASQMHNGATDWMPYLSPLLVWRAFTDCYGERTTCILVLLAAGLYAVAGTAERRAVMRSARMGLMLAVAFMSMAIPLAISAVKPIYYPGRFAIIALAPVAAVLGWGLSLLSPRFLSAGTILVLLLGQGAQHIALRNTSPDHPGVSDRPTADYLLANAAPGDAIVFTSLSRAPADYYFERAGAKTRWLERSFPSSTATHLGWIELSLDEQHRTSLESEAAALTCELSASLPPGARLWVYDGREKDLNAILLSRLSADFAFVRHYVFTAPYHHALLEFTRKSDLPAASQADPSGVSPR